MNSSRLREIVDFLISKEAEFNIQRLLVDLGTALSNMASSPTDPSFQKAYSDAATKLGGALFHLHSEFQPAQLKLLDELHAETFFSPDLSSEIAGWIAENPATPAVAQQQLAALVQDRESYLTRLNQLSDSLAALGIESYDLQEGEAEIGFLLPRSLFNNNLDRLLLELKEVRMIIRAFSELATGSTEEIVVKQISTSDPLFVFGIDSATILAIGGAITWALATWKIVLEIRKLKNDAAKLPDFKDDPIEQMFDDKIKRTISGEVQKEVQQLISTIKGNDARRNEQENHLTMALNSILARVERGMTVEIRLLPPAQDPENEKTEATIQFDNLATIASQLIFPSVEGKPILQLPPPIDRDDAPVRRARAPRARQKSRAPKP